MRSRKRFELPIVVAAILAVLAAACNTSGCFENRSSLPLASFVSAETGESITLDSVAIGGVDAPNDSLLLYPGDKASMVYLPLRSKFSSTSFFIRNLRNGLADTITIDYSSEPKFISEECGALYVYRIEAVNHTRQLIDSVAVLDSTVTNTDIKRLEIIFKSLTNENEQQ